jgi:hypothetical protein
MFGFAVVIGVLLPNIDLTSTAKPVEAVVLQRNLVEHIYYSRKGGNMTGSDIILWPHPSSSAAVPHKSIIERQNGSRRGTRSGILKGLAFECLEYAKIAVLLTTPFPHDPNEFRVRMAITGTGS